MRGNFTTIMGGKILIMRGNLTAIMRGKLIMGGKVILKDNRMISSFIYAIFISQFRVEHEMILNKLRIRKPCAFHIPENPVNPLSEFLYQIIRIQKFNDFRITGKVYFPNIIDPHRAGQKTRTFYHEMIIEHFNLDIRSLNAVIAMGNRIHDEFCPEEFRVFLLCDEHRIFSEFCILSELCFYKCGAVYDLIKKLPLEFDIFYYIHPVADFSGSAFIANEPQSGSGKESLRILSKQQNCGTAHFILSVCCPDEITVMAKKKIRIPSLITDLLTIFRNKVQINVFCLCTINRFILVISHTLSIKQLQSLFEIHFAAFVSYSQKHLVRLVGNQH